MKGPRPGEPSVEFGPLDLRLNGEITIAIMA